MQGCSALLVADGIPAQFPAPEGTIRCWHVSIPAAWVLMPKAAMHTDGNSVLGKDDIWIPGHRLPVKREAEPGSVKE
jgi:hypothetical protein